ncbi:hypothetical protein MMC34_000743 [Xylographa carneopallida]|nr:hypothetical protein [Xylographa carneopallida]
MPRRRPPRAGALADLPPLKIISQIAMLQVAWYVIATVMILFTSLVAGKAFSADLVLSWRSLRGDTTVGWTLGLCWLLDSVVLVILLLLLVARSKLVPDFALTLHFLHLLVTSLYARALPANWLWWGLQACSVALMVSLGVWACRWRELRPMSFGKAKETPGLPVLRGEEEDGADLWGRGRGRGRGRDGAGEYEMLGMEEAGEGKHPNLATDRPPRNQGPTGSSKLTSPSANLKRSGPNAHTAPRSLPVLTDIERRSTLPCAVDAEELIRCLPRLALGKLAYGLPMQTWTHPSAEREYDDVHLFAAFGPLRNEVEGYADKGGGDVELLRGILALRSPVAI